MTATLRRVRTPEHDPRVTTVVITHDGRDRLGVTLDHNPRPLVVVDNASTDGSADVARTVAPDARVIMLDRNEGAVARNIGVGQATSPYVAFADDDSWWAPGSVSLAADVLDAHPSIGLVAARVLVGPESTPDPFCELLARSPLSRGPLEPGSTVLGFMACGAVVRRDALMEVGGFDTVIGTYGEEERVALDLAEAGYRLCYLQDVVVRHFPRDARLARRARASARDDVLTAMMRLSAWTTVTRAVRHLGEGRDRALGVLDALRQGPRALARRRPVSPEVEMQCRILDLGRQLRDLSSSPVEKGDSDGSLQRLRQRLRRRVHPDHPRG